MFYIVKKMTIGLFLIMGMVVAFLSTSESTTAESFSLYELTANDNRFHHWADAVDVAQLNGMLSVGNGYTVLAPVDDAIEAMDQRIWQAMLNDREAMRQFVFYHVVDNQLMKGDISQKRSLLTTLGQPISVLDQGGQLLLNQWTQVVLPDMQASNGILHGVDRVLMPSDAKLAPTPVWTLDEEVQNVSIFQLLQEDGRFKTFLGYLRSVGMENLVDTKGPFTMFVPTDEAYGQLPLELRQRMSTNHAMLRQMLLYHMISGQKSIEALSYGSEASGTLLDKQATIQFGSHYTILNDDVAPSLLLNNVARVIDGDKRASNGILHVVDTVLIPPVQDFSGSQSAPSAASQLHSTFDVLMNDGRFGRFTEDIQRAGLESMLSWHGPFTVFAPTDAAYAALSVAMQQEMSKRDRDFQHLAMYHIVKGQIDLTTLQQSNQLPTMLGEKLMVSNADGFIMLDETVRTVLKEIQTSNGIIYAVDAILIPSNLR